MTHVFLVCICVIFKYIKNLLPKIYGYKYFIGVVEKIGENGEISVSFMSCYTQSFKQKEDIQTVNEAEIMYKIPPPIPISSRYFKIEDCEKFDFQK